jgi:hypothetical protein
MEHISPASLFLDFQPCFNETNPGVDTQTLQITLWVNVSLTGILIIYSFFLMLKMFAFLKWKEQKVMLQTIIFITLGLLCRLIQ